jgi:hypothetical protein
MKHDWNILLEDEKKIVRESVESLVVPEVSFDNLEEIKHFLERLAKIVVNPLIGSAKEELLRLLLNIDVKLTEDTRKDMESKIELMVANDLRQLRECYRYILSQTQLPRPQKDALKREAEHSPSLLLEHMTLRTRWDLIRQNFESLQSLVEGLKGKPWVPEECLLPLFNTYEHYLDKELGKKIAELLQNFSAIESKLQYLTEWSYPNPGWYDAIIKAYISTKRPETVEKLMAVSKDLLTYLNMMVTELQELQNLRPYVSLTVEGRGMNDENLDQILIALSESLRNASLTEEYMKNLTKIKEDYKIWHKKRFQEYEECHRFLRDILEDLKDEMPGQFNVPPFDPRAFEGDLKEGLSKLRECKGIESAIEEALETSSLLPRDSLNLYKMIKSAGGVDVTPETVHALESLSKYIPLKVVRR